MKKIDPRIKTFAALRKAKIVNEFTMAKALRDLFDGHAQLFKPANQVAQLALQILAALNRHAEERNRERLNSGDPLCCQAMWTYGKEATLTILAERCKPLLALKKTIEETEQRLREGSINQQQFQLEQKTIALKIFDLVNPAVNALVEQSLKPAPTAGAFNTAQIGEIVRLFAGVCEVANPNPLDGGPGNLAKNVTLRIKAGRNSTAPLEQVDFNFGDYCGLRAAYRNTAWGSKAFSKAARFRSARSEADMARIGTDSDSVEAAVFKVLDLKPPVRSGNTLFALGETDVVRYMNRALGLLDGADVSGTTCDAIWTLETLMAWLKKFDNSFVVNPNLLLLPVAAIVGGYHHTVLEVGMALSMNYDTGPQRIAYAPGFFTTLQNADMRTWDPDRAIDRILRAAEQHADNVIMLAVDDGTPQRAVYRAEDAERDALRKALELTATTYQVWHELAHNTSVGALRKVYPTLVD